MSRMPHCELEMTRFIRAPREKVYDALVSRDALAAWKCPRGMRADEVTIDPREGGRYLVVMQAGDRSTFIIGGTYHRELVTSGRRASSTASRSVGVAKRRRGAISPTT